MKRTKGQWIASCVLMGLAILMVIIGVIGFAMRGSESTLQTMEQLRAYAVMRTSASGVIDEIASTAKSEAKKWATENIKGRNPQRDYYTLKENEARAEAEQKYADFSGMDVSAVMENDRVLEASLKTYYDRDDQERAVYDGVYADVYAVGDTVASKLMLEVENAAFTLPSLSEELLKASQKPYQALADEDKAGYSEQLLQAAAAIATATGAPAPAADADGMAALTELSPIALEAYAAMDDAAKAACDASIEDALHTCDRLIGGLVGTHWISAAQSEAGLAEFSAQALAAAEAAYGTADEADYQKLFAKVWKALVAEKQASDFETTTVVSEDAVLVDDELTVDYSGYKQSAELTALYDAAIANYNSLWDSLRGHLPELTDAMKDDLREPLLTMIYQADDSFESQYTRYSALNMTGALSSGDAFKMQIANSGDSLFAMGVGLAIFALAVFFYGSLVAKLGMPRLVILLFFVLLCVMAALYGINVTGMIGNVLKRTGMYGVLALAMLPGIQCGITLNMGMTVGIVGGLVSSLIVMENNMTGWPAFLIAVVLGCIIALPIGYAYSKLLNRLKGNEMTVSTYVGFSFVSLMSIAWMLLPFHNSKLTWALGTGLRVMHNMAGSFGAILDKTLSFKVLGIQVPTGLLLFFLLCCLLVWLFSRSKTGTAMIAAGSNPRFAEAAGINVDKMRIIGTTLSTMIAAIGIIVYSQSFGFMQLYGGPRQMGFIAASAILIGGASVARAKVSHVIIGTFLFQGVLAMGIQVANAAISEGGLSEVMRILISNGIILYALTQSGGESRA